MTATNVAMLAIVSPVFVYVIFRAAASGWYAVKERYHRRLVAGIRAGADDNGQSSS